MDQKNISQWTGMDDENRSQLHTIIDHRVNIERSVNAMDHEMYHSTQFIIDYDTVVNSRKCGLVVDWNGLQTWITNVK